MQNHMKQIIFLRFSMPQKVPLRLSHRHLHLHISFNLGMSFSATMTENALQSRTSKKGGTKLSEMITGTHS
ncbi:unnamed protein product [Arabidopsis thaliana]|uniref:Uncharacterized protein n=2 Tax=Arabidopsis thaliana TaxID=3702 RepID=A0A654G2S4_ARATH|nr:uncharacterized protein AT5G19675 [Arabidopsis thaliana]ANM70957.1 hypothetical protein AT5G19675 [Arabidopsis thaliana]CAA0403711.1 unnamed protein product [Arabidopsis thaliana]VYS67366.1 unnamed protein product [Arabidopsis thaliana]|eukprot:NP_001332524.1 hypothetical protein AT5G19675 [Arabidopsis thaliana]